MENGIYKLWNMWGIIWDNMQVFIEFMTQPLSQAVSQFTSNNPWWNIPLNPLIDIIPSLESPTLLSIVQWIIDHNETLANSSLASFLLGTGVIMILLINIIKWIIGIVM